MSDPEKTARILNGWKEIAGYLGRGVRTVQRWESEIGLPVHRPHGKSKSAVIAIPSELDEWVGRTPQLSTDGRMYEPDGTAPKTSAMRVLVVEDSIRDLSTCFTVLRKLGAAEVDVAGNVPSALLRLEEIAAGKMAKPDIMILDLAFPMESGFEVLRYLRSRPALKDIQIVVWTAMTQVQQDLCRFLGAAEVVRKAAGPTGLERALVAHQSQPPRLPA